MNDNWVIWLVKELFFLSNIVKKIIFKGNIFEGYFILFVLKSVMNIILFFLIFKVIIVEVVWFYDEIIKWCF